LRLTEKIPGGPGKNIDPEELAAKLKVLRLKVPGKGGPERVTDRKPPTKLPELGTVVFKVKVPFVKV
jgi:hypothetical protein